MKTKNKKEYNFKSVTKCFNTITKEPEQFLSTQAEKCPNIHKLMQQVYKMAATNQSFKKPIGTGILPELVLDQMDEEQIWQQLELRNNEVLQDLLTQTAKLLALKEDKLEIRLKEKGQIDTADEAENSELESVINGNEDTQNTLKNGAISGGEEEEEDEEDAQFKGDVDELDRRPKRRNVRPSIVDDKFFKLDEMAAFLDAEDAKEMRKQKAKGKSSQQEMDGIDYFADDFSDENAEESDDPNYKDFFNDENENELKNRSKKIEKEENEGKEDGGEDFKAEEQDGNVDEDNESDENEEEDYDQVGETDESKQNTDRVSKLLPDSGSESETEANERDEPKSSFEMRQMRLEQRMRDYEDELLSDKPWQMKGEVQASNRPQNSVLEELLEFEASVHPPPVFTEETTLLLEDIIKQRIRDQAWDDVERQVRPVHTPQEYRKQLVLDQEKSKESLAQIYEKEYQHEIDKLNPNKDNNEEEEPKTHQDIRRLMQELFVKLDALSNFHFIPKPVAPEPKIITNTPALAMEEVAPVAVSDANLLAPEEVYRGTKHELLGKSERDRTDKNRERRHKKQKQRAVHKALEAKDIRRQKLGIPLSKKEEKAKLLKTITKNRNVEKITASKDQTALKSSKAFFNKLQDTTTSVNSVANAKKKKADGQKFSAKRVKL